MRAVVLTRFGPPDVLQLRDIAKPTPADHEILIEVHATTASMGDCELRGLKVPLPYRVPIRMYVGLRRGPVVLGQEVAGRIEAVGKAVNRFKEGDRVFAWTGFGLGGYAEYTCLSERGVVSPIPSRVSYEEAAPLAVGGLEAAYFVRRARIERGHRVLIVGAGGSIGTFAVQLAKVHGAEVTAVDTTGKLDMLRSIGADQVIDYTKEDAPSRGGMYDVVFDVVGKAPFARTMSALTSHGRYLMGNPRLSQRLRGRLSWGRGSREIIPWTARTADDYAADLRTLNELMGSGAIRSVIDRSYAFEQAADAHRYVDSGQKKGSVVIRVGR